LPDLLARAVLEQNGMSGADVRFVVMGSDTDRYKALTAGIVDAAAASTEFVPFAAAQGAKLLLHANDVVPNYLRFCIYSTSKTIAQRSDDLAHFLAAEIAGLRYAMANRDKTVALANQITEAKADDPRAGYIYDEVRKYSAIDPEMPIPADKLDWMEQLLVKTGNMDKPFDPAKIIDGAPREKALGLVGK
jgi:NitT/TauT family transport system substrate-binding protein